jgi:hypothetical protein
MVEVLPENSKSFEKGLGYLHNGYVYIYRGKRKPKKALLPASVYLDEGKPIWVEAPDSEKEKYSIERVFPTDYESIYKEIGDANNLKEVDPSILESSEDFYAPAIEAGDDTLKKIVKTVLASKRINIKAKEDEKNSYYITNLKSGLNKTSPMSIRYFSKWCEILGMDCIISVKFNNADGEEETVSMSLEHDTFKNE